MKSFKHYLVLPSEQKFLFAAFQNEDYLRSAETLFEWTVIVIHKFMC